MVKINVDAGICGLPTAITVNSSDMQSADIEVDSKCPDIQALAAELKTVDPMQEVFTKIGESSVYGLAKKHCKHATCPVPMALLKGIEAAAGLAEADDGGGTAHGHGGPGQGRLHLRGLQPDPRADPGRLRPRLPRGSPPALRAPGVR